MSLKLVYVNDIFEGGGDKEGHLIVAVLSMGLCVDEEVNLVKGIIDEQTSQDVPISFCVHFVLLARLESHLMEQSSLQSA